MSCVEPAISEAQERFLKAAADDLQRTLGIAGVVESLAIDESPSAVTLTARISLGSKTIQMVASGANVVDAYRGLTSYYPAEAILAVAFREVLEA